MSRLVDVEPLEKYLTGLINLARQGEIGIRPMSLEAWKSELNHLNELPTVTSKQKWISAKDSPPTKDGLYFVAYKFWNWDGCVSTREFKNGKWDKEDKRGVVKYWMLIPKIPGDNE